MLAFRTYLSGVSMRSVYGPAELSIQISTSKEVGVGTILPGLRTLMAVGPPRRESASEGIPSCKITAGIAQVGSHSCTSGCSQWNR